MKQGLLPFETATKNIFELLNFKEYWSCGLELVRSEIENIKL